MPEEEGGRPGEVEGKGDSLRGGGRVRSDDSVECFSFVLVAAGLGVVLGQHTRLLVHDLRESAGNMSEEKVRAGRGALNSEINWC